jgi:ATP adenylyltransferase
MQYIEIKKPEGCIFCNKSGENRDRENFILKRGELAFVMLNGFPYNNGHLMVAPYRHIGDISELTHDEMCEIMALTQECCAILKRAFNPDGYNIGMNLGLTAGAGIADHVHMHIVPRWNGDTNFMPVVADVKVLPDSLENTYDKLMAVVE